MFLVFTAHRIGNKKRLPNRYGRGSRWRCWGFLCFFKLFAVSYRLFTAAPFPDLLGWMAGKTPVNLIGWQSRMYRAYGESTMLQRILFRCRE